LLENVYRGIQNGRDAHRERFPSCGKGGGHGSEGIRDSSCALLNRGVVFRDCRKWRNIQSRNFGSIIGRVPSIENLRSVNGI